MKKRTTRHEITESGKWLPLCFSLAFLLQLSSQAIGQTTTLTLGQAVETARRNSPAAVSARHTFRAAYWNWRSFRADQLPSVFLSSSPALNRSIQSVTLPDGSDGFRNRDQLVVDASLNISQNVAFTGGTLYAETALQRLDLFGDKIHSYKSTPVVLGYSQNLFGYNSQKWQRRIQPLRYEEAKKSYVETMELVARTAAQKFFNLAIAQTSWEIASYNFANADTLYRFAQGRYNIGTITENDMLQLEITRLSEQTNMINARIEVEDCILDLRSYLGTDGEQGIEVIPEESIPAYKVDEALALEMAFANNPDITYYERTRQEGESAVASARSQRGLKADFYLEFGLTQTDSRFEGVYHNPLEQQMVTLGLSIPVVDWGVGKGKVKVAQSNLDRMATEAEQGLTDFRLNTLKMVKQFNLQNDQVALAHKTDLTARRRHEVAQKLYLSGKIGVLDLNSATSEKDRARRAYISALYTYWSLYYGIRSMTGYDFENRRLLTEDFDLLIK